MRALAPTATLALLLIALQSSPVRAATSGNSDYVNKAPLTSSGTSGNSDYVNKVPVGSSGTSGNSGYVNKVPVGSSGTSGNSGYVNKVPAGSSGTSGNSGYVNKVPVGSSGTSGNSDYVNKVPLASSGTSGNSDYVNKVPANAEGAAEQNSQTISSLAAEEEKQQIEKQIQGEIRDNQVNAIGEKYGIPSNKRAPCNESDPNCYGNTPPVQTACKALPTLLDDGTIMWECRGGKIPSGNCTQTSGAAGGSSHGVNTIVWRCQTGKKPPIDGNSPKPCNEWDPNCYGKGQPTPKPCNESDPACYGKKQPVQPVCKALPTFRNDGTNMYECRGGKIPSGNCTQMSGGTDGASNGGNNVLWRCQAVFRPD